jgi:cerevisin
MSLPTNTPIYIENATLTLCGCNSKNDEKSKEEYNPYLWSKKNGTTHPTNEKEGYPYWNYGDGYWNPYLWSKKNGTTHPTNEKEGYPYWNYGDGYWNPYLWSKKNGTHPPNEKEGYPYWNYGYWDPYLWSKKNGTPPPNEKEGVWPFYGPYDYNYYWNPYIYSKKNGPPMPVPAPKNDHPLKTQKDGDIYDNPYLWSQNNDHSKNQKEGCSDSSSSDFFEGSPNTKSGCRRRHHSRRCCEKAPSPPKYIVLLKKNIDLTTKINELETKYKFKCIHTIKNVSNGFVACIDNTDIPNLLMDPDILSVELDKVVKFSVPEKLASSNGMSSWSQAITNCIPSSTDDFSSVNCWIVDTGILPNHIEFSNGQVSLDYNAITKTKGNSIDDNGHGTGVSTSLGGINVGVAIKTRLHSIKVLDATGAGYVSDIISGLDYIMTNANLNTPNIINLSLDGGNSLSLDTAVQACISYGIPVCVAAGNSGVNVSTQSPADAFGAIVSAAYDQNKAVPSWSNFGSGVTVVSPGVGLTVGWGTGPSDYYIVAGTSFSSPITAGLIVRFLKANPKATVSVVNSFIKAVEVNNQLTGVIDGTPNTRMVYKSVNTPICV